MGLDCGKLSQDSLSQLVIEGKETLRGGLWASVALKVSMSDV
jgi:hypothetical protein